MSILNEQDIEREAEQSKLNYKVLLQYLFSNIYIQLRLRKEDLIEHNIPCSQFVVETRIKHDSKLELGW